MVWEQNYNPLQSVVLSTLVAAVPVVVLLGSIAFARLRIHLAAALGLAVALGVALGVYRMPLWLAVSTAGYGAAYGLFPIGWIILNVIFLYQLTVAEGRFEVLRNSLAAIAPDQRIQVVLIAFCFGAFIEGVAGFGAPVAITAAILIQLGFRPLQASGLALIANTAPVAFGSLGIPITTLSKVTGMDVHALSQMVGRQLPFFSVLVPAWVVVALAGFRGLRAVWPAAVTAGVSFAVPQFLISNYHGPWLVDIVSAMISIVAVVVLLRYWRPRDGTPKPAPAGAEAAGKGGAPAPGPSQGGMGAGLRPSGVIGAWLPWVILSVFIFIWGLPPVKAVLNQISNPQLAVPGLHLSVRRAPPVAPVGAAPEKAVYDMNWLSATGTGILLASIVAGTVMRIAPLRMMRIYGQTVWRVRYSLLTIAGMLALGQVTKYSGTDATLGLALAQTGALYPFFGTLLGWLGVALTGSDTASNVLFGSLQQITATQTGISPILMGAANSSGGVMGKMVDAQSIVVASTATGWYGHEGEILRYVFWHSIALATLVGLVVYLQAYVYPFTLLVVH